MSLSCDYCGYSLPQEHMHPIPKSPDGEDTWNYCGLCFDLYKLLNGRNAPAELAAITGKILANQNRCANAILDQMGAFDADSRPRESLNETLSALEDAKSKVSHLREVLHLCDRDLDYLIHKCQDNDALTRIREVLENVSKSCRTAIEETA